MQTTPTYDQLPHKNQNDVLALTNFSSKILHLNKIDYPPSKKKQMILRGSTVQSLPVQ